MSVKVEVTPEALTQVRELIQAQAVGTSIRLFVQPGGGGCGDGCGCGASSGPAFGLAFDRARPGDEVIPVDGFSLLVDAMAAASVDGARIDFVQELDRSGFRVIPANAPAPVDAPKGEGGGCGCGSGGCC
jgi:Fe-S cluster assembly iron-binding protein IscA